MRRAARVLALTAGLAMVLPGLPAQASSQRILYRDGTDRISWYWNKQIDEEVGGGPVSQRVRMGNPQNPDTLPVAVEGGKLERISAIYFDLSSRGVTAGSAISKAVLTITEVSDPNEQPPYNTQGKVIQACRIDDYWPAGNAEKWETAPNYDDSSCAKGKRDTTPRSEPPTWTFNLTRIAQPWGEDPFGSNNGVMLLGVVPNNAGPLDSWQINLKVPSRDRVATPQNESRVTRDRAFLSLAFTPGQPSALVPPAPPPPPPPPPDFGSSAAVPSSELGTQPGGETPTPQPTPTGEGIQAKPVGQVQPRAPWYAWMLIPLGLLAWAAVRPLVLEPARGLRPGGAVSTIRALNAQRRGMPLEEPTDPLVRAIEAFQGAGRRIAGAAGVLRTGAGRAAGGIGAVAGGVTRIARAVRRR
jgi:hypothetical protein